MKILKKLSVAMLFLPAMAMAEKSYEITVTNITKGMSFTPLIGVTHSKFEKLFEVGEPASQGIIDIAEGGNVATLQDSLSADAMSATTEGLLAPGASVTFTVSSDSYSDRLTLASMLLPTNDTFVALNSVRLPYYGTRTYLANAYDAGSEANDELCSSIPGPTCGGEPFSPDDLGEGYIFSSPGVHGEADLSRAAYGFSGPVAKVKIKAVY